MNITVIQPSSGLFNLDLKGVWQYRELLFFLIWRDLKVRYKQAAIGVGWAIIQPLLTMVIFTIIFGQMAKIPSDGIPYPLFSYAALLPWNYFSQALSRSGGSLVGDANLLSKVYFPRLIIPLATVITPLFDFAISFFILLIMMAWYGVMPTWGIIALPFFLLFALMVALAVSLWLAPINVRFRDVGHAIPFLVQIWMYASPIVYPVSLVPEKWRALYGLNPMAGVIEGFRWALLGSKSPNLLLVGVGVLLTSLLLLAGVVFFKWMERTFADII
jgi:lipopolysaccharide transport system permease protein